MFRASDLKTNEKHRKEMNPNNEQIALLEDLKRRPEIKLPFDAITIRNLYVDLVNNKAHICTTCPSTVALHKRKLLDIYERFLATKSPEEKTLLDEAIAQVNALKEINPTKEMISEIYGKRVIRYKIEDNLIFINGSKTPQLKISGGEIVKIDDLNSDDDLINNILS